ncbi:MAG: hypothetical protein GXY33_11700 [Phycisphaerae bacterium]|nr:hypothetical protein [Phycisphaerae bacterium]
MRRSIIAASICGVLVLAAGSRILAQSETAGEPARAPTTAREKAGVGEGLKNLIAQRLRMAPRALEMTEDQTARYRELARDYFQQVEELTNQLNEKTRAFRAEVDQVLTPEQRERLERMQMRRAGGRSGRGQGPMGGRPGAGAGMMLRPGVIEPALDRTDLPQEKKEQVLDIVRGLREQFRSVDRGDRQARRQVMEQAVEQIRQILTPEEFGLLRDKVCEVVQEQGMDRGPRWEGRGGPPQGSGWSDRPGPRHERFGPGQGRGRGFDNRGWDRPRNQTPPPPPPADQAPAEPDWLW